MQYRRSTTQGATYFFTVVTHHRRPCLCHRTHIALLREAFRYVRAEHPFHVDAAVVLPDHLHCMWTLPGGDNHFSSRWRLIKSYFSRGCDPEYRLPPSASRQKKQEQAVWQRRFWEHQIRDERDFIQHVEYIHYNPVKHGLVSAPKDWPYSSFHQYVWRGVSPADWGTGTVMTFGVGVGNE